MMKTIHPPQQTQPPPIHITTKESITNAQSISCIDQGVKEATKAKADETSMTTQALQKG